MVASFAGKKNLAFVRAYSSLFPRYRCHAWWEGQRCELRMARIPYKPLSDRMLQEPFWLGLITVFVVLAFIGLVWCAKRHFPEKIEKLLAEEAERNRRNGRTICEVFLLFTSLFLLQLLAFRTVTTIITSRCVNNCSLQVLYRRSRWQWVQTHRREPYLADWVYENLPLWVWAAPILLEGKPRELFHLTTYCGPLHDVRQTPPECIKLQRFPKKNTIR